MSANPTTGTQANDLSQMAPQLSSSLIDNSDTPPEAASNPWTELVDSFSGLSTSQPAHEIAERHMEHTPDPSVLDDTATTSLEACPAPTQLDVPRVSGKILGEFDLFANPEEKEAQEAWKSAEGHPPPPRQPSPTNDKPDIPPTPPSKDTPNQETPSPTSQTTTTPSQSTSGFTSLAAFARSFSIPTLPRSRPLSVDGAKPVPSPTTLSSFASQQQTSGTSLSLPNETNMYKANGVQASGTSTPNRGNESPVPGSKNSGDPGGTTDPPFDFQKFLDQMKSKNAEPVAKYLRSFLSNFAKRTFTVNDQVKIINDFLSFISVKMREIDIWKNASDTEFDNAMEGMEKLVMNRLYDFTFTPQVARSVPPRPITTDDLERDRVLSQRIALFNWIEEKHLDVPEGEGSKGFLMFAEQELIKINHYKAPRDKLICILNCCKVIFGLIRHLHQDEGADSFVPILIFVVLKTNPDHLLSNVEFINRFRNPEKLQSEAGYYLSSLMGAVSFIETMDHSSLSNITQEVFERRVEEAIQSLPPSDPQSPALLHINPSRILTPSQSPPSLSSTSHAGEESAQPLSLPTPQTLSEDARRLLQKTGDTISKPLSAIGKIFTEALDGADGKLSYLPGPFAPFELGRERREDRPSGSVQGSPQQHWSHPDQVSKFSGGYNPQTPQGDGTLAPPIQTPYKPRIRRNPSPSYANQSPTGSPKFSAEDTPTRYGLSNSPSLPYTNSPLALGPSNILPPPRVQSLSQSHSHSPSPSLSTRPYRAGSESLHVSRTPTPALDLAEMQAQIDTAHERAAEAARETLRQIFPAVDGEVVEWVLEANQGDLGKSIEALLEMSSGT